MEISQLLKKHGFSFSKALGQNFITDTNLLKAIVTDSGVEDDDTVLEIGAGSGTLTRELAKKAKRVKSFETDKRLMPILSEVLKGEGNVEIIYADALKYPQDELAKIIGGKYKIVANLPYYITTPLIFHFLDDENLSTLTVMVQKEVAQRFCAKENTPEYGAVTVQLSSKAKVSIKRTVPRNMFTPPPSVDSAVVHIQKVKNESIVNPQHLKQLIAAAFAMRRKTLANNIASAFSLNKQSVTELLEGQGIAPNARGETLSTADFIALSNKMQEEKTKQN